MADGQGVQDVPPAVAAPCRVRSVLSPLDRGQVAHFQRGVLGREVPSATRYLSVPCIERLDAVGIGYEIR